MKRFFILSLYLLLVLCGTKAQNITVDAPTHVQTGENFRIAYSVNTQDVENFRAGSYPSGLELIAGPYTSQQKSFQMINGHTSSSSSITYTYIVYADKPGTYNMPQAHCTAQGKQIKSRTFKVTVSGTKNNTQGAPKMHDDQDDGSERMSSTGKRISPNELFIRVSANKKTVHEQEPVLLTYKVYTLVGLTQLEGKMPELTGFHTQEVPLPQQKSFHVENVNGRNYRCVTWSQYVMYPQMTGLLKVPSITFKGIVVKQNRSVDPFEAFFNGGSGYIEIKHNVVAPEVNIKVEPLPQRPNDFSGGVGKFNISAQMDNTEVKAGNPVNLRVIVGGTGNLKLIKRPVLTLPKDFDQYDPKITDKTRLTSNGVEGNMIYDYLIVPRNKGKYEIPSITFTFYDTSSNSYKTIATKSFKLNVEKGNGRETIDDFSKQDKNDIRDIKKGNTNLLKSITVYQGSTQYWMMIIIPLILFFTLLIIFRKRAIENSDIAKQRGKKANKVASKKLRKAQALMFKNAHDEFYDEVLKALWGYISDKMNISVEKLSRENIAEMLASYNVDDNTIQTFIGAIDECEYERYAPGDLSGNMSKTFNSAMTAIETIETVMKKSKKHNKKDMRLSCIILLATFALSANAITKQNADTEYKRGNYQQAIADYKEILRNGVSADIYYNLGNAYYRTDSITQAVIAYERAYKLAPGDADIQFNIKYLQTKTIDKIVPQNEMFFVTWYHSLVNFTSANNWAHVSVVLFIISLTLMLVYLMASRIVIRKICFFSAMAGILLFVLFNVFSYQQNIYTQNNDNAVIISTSAPVKKTPSSTSTDEFILHEGTKVVITDHDIKGWKSIRIADGREGWILSKQLEEI